MELVNALIENIKAAGTVCLAGHEKLDGDATAAVYAMADIVRGLGATPVILLEKRIPKFDFIFNPAEAKVAAPEEIEMFIALDCAQKNRLGVFGAAFDRAKRTVNIDHHVTNTEYAQTNIVEDISSTSELIYKLFADKVEILKETAEKLYLGILTDTNGFRNNNVTAETHRVVAALLEKGTNGTEIYDKALWGKTHGEMRALRAAYRNLTFFGKHNKIAVSYISDVEMKKSTITVADVEGCVEAAFSVLGVEIAVFCYNVGKGLVKASFRSRSVDVSKIAVKYGGGGHKLAAGATFNGLVENVVKKVVTESSLLLKLGDEYNVKNDIQ